MAALSGEEKVEDEGSVYGRRIFEEGEGVNWWAYEIVNALFVLWERKRGEV
jgi:hypothetical protein